MPRRCVTDLIASGQGAGLPVLASTTSAQVAADLADLVNVVVAHQMDDPAAARRLSEADPADLSSLRDGEFLLAVKNPRRLVPRGVLVRARVPSVARDGVPAGVPRRAWEGA